MLRRGPIALKTTAIISLLLESMRWILQGRFPELLHPAAPGSPAWSRLFYIVQLVFFGAASYAAGAHIIQTISTRDWKKLDHFGLALYFVWWLEVLWVGRYLVAFLPLHTPTS